MNLIRAITSPAKQSQFNHNSQSHNALHSANTAILTVFANSPITKRTVSGRNSAGQNSPHVFDDLLGVDERTVWANTNIAVVGEVLVVAGVRGSVVADV